MAGDADAQMEALKGRIKDVSSSCNSSRLQVGGLPVHMSQYLSS